MAKTKTKKKTLRKKHSLQKQLIKSGGVAVTVAATFLVLANMGVQLFKKPSEVLSVIAAGERKSLQQTWATYKEDFMEHSTEVMTPTFLAAMAQAESAGNSLNSPEWRVNLNASLFNLYAPQSSSVGLMQFTEGTFDIAKKYCIHKGQVKKEGPWHDFSSCWFNSFYTRLSASDSIEMTSAYLHDQVEKLLAAKNKTTNIYGKQTLAAAIHLCGLGRVKRAFKGASLKLKKCGSHSFGRYLSRLRRFQSQLK